MKWQEVLPVLVSILVIILVAAIEKQSKLVAAITATMPLGIPLALWIVYASSRGEKSSVEQFTRNMAIGIWPTVAFAVAIWLAARSGMKLTSILLVGYTTWVLSLVAILSIRKLIGI